MKKTIVTLVLLAIVLFIFGQTENSSNPIPEQAFSFEKAFYLNDTIWVLDSTLQQRKVDDEFVNQRKKIIQSHDEQGRNITSISENWHSTEEAWLKNTRDSVVFSFSGLLSEKFVSDWNTNESNWKLTFYNKLDENGKPLERIQLNWNNERNKYLYGFKQWTEFDETGLPQNAFWNEFDSISQDFVTDGRTTYFYDENNLNTFTLWEKWNPISQTWEPRSSSEMFYNAEGLLVQRLSQKWDVDEGAWQNRWKNIVYYNAAGLADTNEFYSWLQLYSMWYPSYRLIGTYGEQGRLVESIRQEDGYGGEKWINESRILQLFENGKLTERRTQKWSSGNWIDDRIELRTYVNDTLFESQIYINYDPYNGVYDTTRRYILVFNERFLPEKLLGQGYSKETSEFITFWQQIYYFSPLASPDWINETEQLEFTVYPNPSSGIFQIKLPEQSAKDARIIVSGLSGNIVFQSLVGSEKINIDLSGQAKGVYFIQIISANKPGTKKIVRF